MTKDEIIDAWLTTKRPNTVRVYRSDVLHLFAYCGKTLRNVTVEDIERFCTLAPPSVNRRRRAAIKSLFAFAITQHNYRASRLINLYIRRPKSHRRAKA